MSASSDARCYLDGTVEFDASALMRRYRFTTNTRGTKEKTKKPSHDPNQISFPMRFAEPCKGQRLRPYLRGLRALR
jgi:hypothetical protein